MKKAELLEIASACGLTNVNGGMTKAEIISVITEAV